MGVSRDTISTSEKGLLTDLIKRAPCFQSCHNRPYTIDRLNGLTNSIFLLSFPHNVFVVRLPGAGTEAYIDRATELHNARIASRLGFGADILWCDETTGMMVTAPVHHARHFGSHAHPIDQESLSRLVKALMALHRSNHVFKGRFDPFYYLTLYRGMLDGYQDLQPYQSFLDNLFALQSGLEAGTRFFSPCHCDLVAANILDDGKRVHLIDWEYSAMNDPAFDLAYFSLETELAPDQEALLLSLYKPDPEDVTFSSRYQMFKPVCDGISGLWAGVRVLEGEEMTSYMIERLDRGTQALSRLDIMPQTPGL